jgi:hypothetical protein
MEGTGMVSAGGNDSTPKPASSSSQDLRDSFTSPPRLVPTATLEWLLDQGVFEPSECSPLKRQTSTLRITSADQRARAGRELLTQLGLPESTRTSSFRFRSTWLGRALAVLERPEARLRVAIAAPGAAPRVQQFYLREGRAVAGFLDLEGFCLAEPLALSDLMELLLASSSNRALPTSLDALCVLPEVYELAAVLWQRRGKSIDEPISRREVEGLLADGPERKQAALELLNVLLEVGLLEPRGTRWFIHDNYRPWLELVWSGHVLEIERTPLGLGESEALPQRLLFAGPPSQRVLCEDVVASAGEPLVLLSRLLRSDLKSRLARLLRPAGAVPAMLASGVTSPPRSGDETEHRDIDIN